MHSLHTWFPFHANTDDEPAYVSCSSPKETFLRCAISGSGLGVCRALVLGSFYLHRLPLLLCRFNISLLTNYFCLRIELFQIVCHSILYLNICCCKHIRTGNTYYKEGSNSIKERNIYLSIQQ